MKGPSETILLLVQTLTLFCGVHVSEEEVDAFLRTREGMALAAKVLEAGKRCAEAMAKGDRS